MACRSRFSLAADKIGHPLAFEPEGGPSDEALAWNVMTWGQYQFPFVPMVDRYKWLETRHMVNICDRWNADKTDDLQFAFFNGVGWESWENIWGIWNGITPRDAEATRRDGDHRARRCSVPGQPGVGAAVPHAQSMASSPAAGRWADETLWTIVNRNEYDVDGRQMTVPAKHGMRYFDLYHGVELKPERRRRAAPCFAFTMEAHGFGAMLATPGEPSDAMQNSDGDDGSDDREAAVRVIRMSGRSLPQTDSSKFAPTKPAASSAGRHGQDSGGRFRLQGAGNRD